MNPIAFAASPRLAADRLSRRGSLMTLGVAGLATILGGSVTAAAKKPGKKRASKRCQRQVAPCAAAIQALCEELDAEPDVCEAVKTCCRFFGRCNATGFLTCTVDS